MQGYSYSVFSLAAIAVHLIINFNLFREKDITAERDRRYCGFLMGTLAYYVFDAAWGIFAGLGWTVFLYIDTILFFLGLAVFAFMWCRFVVAYLGFSRWTAGVLVGSGCALLAVNIVMLTANIFNQCIFYFDQQGTYLLGPQRYLLFFILIAFNILMAIFVFARVLGSRDSVRSRNMMIFVHCLTMTASVTLQVIWPLTPFTSLGCLIGNCFLHVFVIKDEQTARHMAELEKALEQAHAAEKARSMFFSIVSHDIRTPLNAILGYSELLRSGVMKQSEKDEALESIRASGTMLLQLVNDVLDLAKIESGKITLQPEPVCLNQLTDEVFASFRMTAAGKGIELVNRTEDMPIILLDEHRFRQILFNLVGNAVKFTERGTVTVSASYVESNLEVSVSDTGCGIAPDMLAHVLEPFVQVQDPTHAADRAGGTGLGLSICRSLVEVMGGRLTVESKLGVGSTFKTWIPNIAVNEEKERPSVVPDSAPEVKNRPQRVLVVDDSSVNRAVLSAFLKRTGVPAIGHAGNGNEAIEALDSALKTGHPYDFVFSDLWMPTMNGLEFIEKVRADSRFSRLPA